LRPAVSRWRTPAAFFPWRHVQRWINRVAPARLDECQKRSAWAEYVPRARPCRGCGRAPGDLRYFLVLRPEAEREAGTGKLGILVLCERCRLQVDFRVHRQATREQARQWREERRLIGDAPG